MPAANSSRRRGTRREGEAPAEPRKVLPTAARSVVEPLTAARREPRPPKRRNAPVILELDITARAGKQFVPYLRKHLLAAHRMLRPPLRELSLVLVGDERMSRLHMQVTGVPGPTDVLTFPLEMAPGPTGRAYSGEVIVCVPEARRQARARGEASPRRELLLYALHGVLHLCGFDDRTDRDFRIMHRTEDRLLTRLGVGNVFAVFAVNDQPAAAPAAKDRGKPRAGSMRKARR